MLIVGENSWNSLQNQIFSTKEIILGEMVMINDILTMIAKSEKDSKDIILEVKNKWYKYAIEQVDAYFDGPINVETFNQMFKKLMNHIRYLFKDISNFHDTVGEFVKNIQRTSPAENENAVKNIRSEGKNDPKGEMYDIGDLELKFLSDSDRTRYANSTHVIPEKEYKFPFTLQANKKKSKRFASHNHLETFSPWLVFSFKKMGYFCKYCAIAYSGKKSNFISIALVDKVLDTFTDLTGKKGKLESHSNTKSHKEAIKVIYGLIDESKGKGIKQYTEEALKKVENAEKVNRNCFKIICDLAITLAKQAIAFRGHRDSGKIDLYNSSVNEGNWREMIKFSCRINLDLKNFVDESPKNASYISHQTYHKIHKIAASMTTKIILNEIDQARFFSIMFDETTDVSGKNILTFVVRYLKNGELTENFLGFFDVHEYAKEFYDDNMIEKKLSGKILGQIVQRICSEFGLNLKNCSSVGTDGDSKVISKEKGAVTYIKQSCSKITTHSYCLSHIMNLSISNCASVIKANEIIKTINTIANFFQYQKRKSVLDKYAKCTSKLKTCSETRQIERLEPLTIFKIKYQAVVLALCEIEKWDEITNASELKEKIIQTEFVANLHYLEDVMRELKPLAVYLQQKNINLYEALKTVKKFSEKLNDKICGKDALKNFYAIAEQIKQIIAKISPNNTCPDFTHEQKKTFFKNYSIFLKNYIDNLDMRLQKREFTSAKISKLHPKYLNSLTDKDIDDIVETYCEAVSENGPSVVKIQLQNEIENLKEHGEFYKLETFETLSYKLRNSHRILSALFNIIGCVSVTTASAERTFSKLKLIKTFLRNCLSTKNLSNQAVLSVNREYEIDIENLMICYAKIYNIKLII